jgi:tetratricopeptide (TPR) repeat protein
MRSARIFMGAIVAISMLVAIASGKDKKDAAKGPDPSNRTGLSKQMTLVVEGNAKFANKDMPGALDAYKRAVQAAPNDPLAHYLVAEAELAQGHLPETEAALGEAEKLSDRRPDIMGKVMFLQADTKERAKKWSEAKAAWLRYSEWAKTHAEAGAVPQTATARVQAIDDAIKLDAQYEDVRKRIAEEKDGGKSDGGK